MQRNYGVLSDIEFEDLIADLLEVERSTRYERFAAGRDKGIDLRDAKNANDIVQCKHYWRSDDRTLMRALKKELEKVSVFAPTRYTLATSHDLTPAQKDSIRELFSPHILSVSDIFGVREIDALLDKHGDIERRHYKLWLSSTEILGAIVHSDVYNRSQFLVDALSKDLRTFVQTASFGQAHNMLVEKHVVVVAGMPGIGKTTLAKMLLLDSLATGFEPVDVSTDIDEGVRVWKTGPKQIFYYDDFLGRTTLQRMLAKNEDRRLAEFIERVASDSTKRLILTTREYILTEAAMTYDSLKRTTTNRQFILELRSYRRADRARVLYNHLYHSDLPAEFRRAFLVDRCYLKIIDHRSFNPRLIEALAAQVQLRAGTPEQVPTTALAILDRPMLLWETAFESELGDVHRGILVTLATFPRGATHTELGEAFERFAKRRGLTLGVGEWERALKILEATFIRIDKVGTELVIEFDNPSIEDFLVAYLAGHATEYTAAVESALFFEQVRHLTEMRPQGSQLSVNEALSAMGAVLDKPLTEAFARTIPLPGPRVRVAKHLIGPVNAEGATDSRLAYLCSLAGRLPALRPMCESLVTRRLDGLSADDLSEATITLLSVVRGVTPLAPIADNVGIPKVRGILLDGLSDNDAYPDWQMIRSFKQAFPGDLAEEDLLRVRSEFERFAIDEFEATSLPDSLDEIDTMATFLGASRSLLSRIEAAIEYREEQRREEPDDDRWDVEGGDGTGGAPTEADDEELDAVFEKLRDE